MFQFFYIIYDFENPVEIHVYLNNKDELVTFLLKAAKKINEGGHKRVCAWVVCEDVIFVNGPTTLTKGESVSYNPRIAPNWVCNGSNCDKKEFELLFTSGKQLFTKKDEKHGK